jgi:hypothetical protein
VPTAIPRERDDARQELSDNILIRYYVWGIILAFRRRLRGPLSSQTAAGGARSQESGAH